jgi:cellulose synthase/poly-beta-1,6-N-acetylglucosamine synthase-like glycosyltransferase
MEGFAGLLADAQVVFFLLIMVPIFYWFSMKIFSNDGVFSQNMSLVERRICVILPMRNEITNVERKLSGIIDEILPHEFVNLIVADSNSDDGTGKIAEKILNSSGMDTSRWKIMDFEIKGKNVAINGVLTEIEADIVVISDADAKVSPGWLEIVRIRMEEEDVGVVSGVEREVSSKIVGFNGYYRGKSNWLRIRESKIDSTPVLEGSILAWKTSALGPFRLNERMNADDAQIGFISMRGGHRSIIDERITFRSFEGSPERTFGESVRRAQGLSIALLKNADLVISSPRRSLRRVVFNALFLYVIFPWASLLFAVNSVVAFSLSPELGNTWQFYSIISIILVLFSPQGRFLARGAAISIAAHSQALIGRRYCNWEPKR